MPVTRGEPVAAAASGRLGDLGTRAVSAAVLVVLALGSAWAGGLVFAGVWFAAAAAVAWEWQRLVAPVGARRRGALAICGLAGLLLALTVGLTAAFATLAALSLVEAALAPSASRAWAAGGMAYAGLLLLAVCVLRASPAEGALALAWLFATVWATDVSAYFGGRLIGGRKIWPRVSPSKTWSGTLTGIAAGGLCGAVVALQGRPGAAIGPPLMLSVATAALSQAGDAFESAMKRRFGVKDSGRLIPGHGGMMDRLDGFAAAAILALAVGTGRDLPSVASGLFQW